MSQPLTIERKIELVKNAINRVEMAKAIWEERERDSSSSTEDRKRAARMIAASENEFGWQWKNVRDIFREKGL